MKRKRIKVPLYPNVLIMYLCDDLKEIQQKYDLSDCSNYDAIVFEHKGFDIVAFSKTKSPDYIAHEASHIANNIFRSIGATLDFDNDEPYCYLLEWVVKECHKFLDKK